MTPKPIFRRAALNGFIDLVFFFFLKKKNIRVKERQAKGVRGNVRGELGADNQSRYRVCLSKNE